MIVTYKNTTKRGSKADPRFTIEADGMPTFGDGDKARPVVEIPTDNGLTLRIVMPRNVYIPNGSNVGEVSFNVDSATVSLAPASGGPDGLPRGTGI
jgi:hypothetical protein